MTRPTRFFIQSGIIMALVIGIVYALGATQTTVQSTITLTDAEKKTVKDFEKRTQDYAALHKKLSATIPALPDKATPEQIDKHQKSMVALIVKERKNAKPGDLFTPDMVVLVRRASGAAVAGYDGKQNKETIVDENPGTLPEVGVNDKYPEAVPIATMPAELLQTLPKLPEGQEYRFLGKRLVLVDTCCQLVLDITPNVLS